MESKYINIDKSNGCDTWTQVMSCQRPGAMVTTLDLALFSGVPPSQVSFIVTVSPKFTKHTCLNEFNGWN